MDPHSPDDARAEAAVWQAMVLFSTLSTATTVWHAARERRAGRDPSAQEQATFVRAYLRRAAGELQALLMQLQAGLIQAEHAEDHRQQCRHACSGVADELARLQIAERMIGRDQRDSRLRLPAVARQGRQSR